MARDPSLLPALSDFAGAAGAPFPTGWQDGPYNGESGWQLDGAGAMVPSSGSGWRNAQTVATTTRGASPGGVAVEFATLPTGANPFFIYLSTANESAGGVDGYAIRWSRTGADINLYRWTDGGADGGPLGGLDEVDVTGTIAAGFRLAIIWDDAGVEGFASTDGGATWQTLHATTDTTYTGAGRGGVEGNGSGAAITSAAFGLQTAPPADGLEGAELRTPRDLRALIRVAKAAGQGVLARRGAAGADLTPPATPSSPGWTTVADLVGDASVFRELEVAVPTNDDAYPLALYATESGAPVGDPIMVYAFGIAPVLQGPRGATFASLLIPTNRPCQPRLELAPDPTFASPVVYDADVDGPSGWRLVTAAEAAGMASSTVGVALTSGGIPAGSAGKYARRAVPDTKASYHVRGKLVAGG